MHTEESRRRDNFIVAVFPSIHCNHEWREVASSCWTRMAPLDLARPFHLQTSRRSASDRWTKTRARASLAPPDLERPIGRNVGVPPVTIRFVRPPRAKRREAAQRAIPRVQWRGAPRSVDGDPSKVDLSCICGE